MRVIIAVVMLLVMTICTGCDNEKSLFMEKAKYEICSGRACYYTDNYTMDSEFVVLKDWVIGGNRYVYHSVLRLGKGQIEYIKDWD